MKISANSRLIRYAYIFGDKPPATTTLCRLFWRTVFITTVFAFILFLLSAYVTSWILHTKDTAIGTGFVLGVFSIIGFFGWLDHYLQERELRKLLEEVPPQPPSVLREAVYAVKHKVCPIIQIERE